MKIEISPHARRRLAVRMIPEDLVFSAIRDPERVLFDKESGYFIEENTVRVITAFLTSDPNTIERRIRRGRWGPL